VYSFLHYHAKLQNFLNACPQANDEALKEAVKEWLEGQAEDFYFSGINMQSARKM